MEFDSTLQSALTQVLNRNGMPAADYEVTDISLDNVPSSSKKRQPRFDDTVKNHQLFEVTVRRKRQRSHGRAKVKCESGVTFRVVRTTIQEIVDEIPNAAIPTPHTPQIVSLDETARIDDVPDGPKTEVDSQILHAKFEPVSFTSCGIFECQNGYEYIVVHVYYIQHSMVLDAWTF